MKKRIIIVSCMLALLIGMLTGCSRPSVEQEGDLIDIPSKPAITKSEDTEKTLSKKVPNYTIYVRTCEDWGVPNLWAWSDTEGDLYTQWPGQPMGRGADDWYTLSIPVTYDNVVISDRNGDEKTDDEWTGGMDTWFVIENDSYEIYTDWPNIATEPNTLTKPPKGYIEVLIGSMEQAHIQAGSSSFNVTAEVYDEMICDCTEMTLLMEVEMYAGTNCKDWQVWGRSGNNYFKLHEFYLPEGDGFGSQTFTFDTPVSFDAIAITPMIPGNYSWSMNFAVIDVWTKP